MLSHEIPNSPVLSDVHIDCQYQVIPGSDHAVTRLKIHFPHLKDSSYRHHNILDVLKSNSKIKEQADTDHDIKPKTYFREAPEKETDQDKHSSVEHETKPQFDEDGDLVLDRNPCKSGDFSDVTARKKIKLDVPIVTARFVSHDEAGDEFDHCERVQLPNVELGASIAAGDQGWTGPELKHVTCQWSNKNNESHQPFVSDCKDKDLSISSDRPDGDKIKVCEGCVNGRPTNISEQSVSGHKRNNAKQESSYVLEETEDDTPDIYYINIKHSLATDLDDVGEQVWHGALILSDYIISNHENFENKTIVDLGAGVGLSSMVAAMYASKVFCTDTGEKVLSLAEDNILSAKACPTLPRPLCEVHVRQLDWFKGLEEDGCKHGLTKDDISRICDCDILIAADVIYDFDITDAFFNVVQQIMRHPPSKALFIGLEKRIVFTVVGFTATSPGYNYFRLHLEDLCSEEENDPQVFFEVEQLDPSFPQYFQYNRIKQLELWKITAKLRT